MKKDYKQYQSLKKLLPNAPLLFHMTLLSDFFWGKYKSNYSFFSKIIIFFYLILLLISFLIVTIHNKNEATFNFLFIIAFLSVINLLRKLYQ